MYKITLFLYISLELFIMKKRFFENLITFFVKSGILHVEECILSTEEELMNKILKQLHPYEIGFVTTENKYKTYVKKPNGDRLAVRGKTVKEVEQKLLLYYKDEIEKLERGTTPSMQNLWVEFMRYKVATQKNGTVEKYIKNYTAHYLNNPISKIPLAQINANTLKAFLVSTVKENEMTKTAYNNFQVVLNQMFKWAIEEAIVDFNSFDRINSKMFPFKNNKKKLSSEKCFQSNEVEAIMNLAMDDFLANNDSVAIAVMLSFFLGTRVSELVSIKQDDILFDEETKNWYVRLHRMEVDIQNFNENFTKLTTCSRTIIEDEEKGIYGSRLVPLSEDAKYLIDILLAYYKSKNIITEWLFVYDTSKKITNRGIHRHLEKYCKLANIKSKSIHKTRSTYISKLRDAGISFERIAEYVGHKSIKTTINNYSYDTATQIENLTMLNNGLNMGFAK